VKPEGIVDGAREEKEVKTTALTLQDKIATNI